MIACCAAPGGPARATRPVCEADAAAQSVSPYLVRHGPYPILEHVDVVSARPADRLPGLLYFSCDVSLAFPASLRLVQAQRVIFIRVSSFT